MTRLNWKELTMIQIGGAVCMPLLLIGFEIGKNLPFFTACLVILVANAFLTLMAMAVGRLAYSTGLSTTECIASILGEPGRLISGFLISITMVSWFSIQTEVVVQDILNLFRIDNGMSIPVTALFIALMAGSCLYGLKAISKLSAFATPVMAITLALACINCVPDRAISGFRGSYEDIQKGLLIVVGGAVMAVLDLPTFFRAAKTEQDVHKATIASFLLGVSAVEAIGAYLSQGAQSCGLVSALVGDGGYLLLFVTSTFIVLAGWTTNVTNLYSGGVAARALFPAIVENKLIIFMALVGFILTQLGLYEHFGVVLELFAIATIALGSELVKSTFVTSTSRASSWFAVSIGTSIGMLDLFFGSSFSGIAILDVLIVTLTISIAGSKILGSSELNPQVSESL